MPMVQTLDFHWTPDDVRALPDDGARHECVDGTLVVTPAPNGLHQRAVMLLLERLLPYVRAQRIGEVLPSPADIQLDPDALVQPDLFVYRIPAEGIVKRDWSIVRALALAVEVLSPASAAYDRGLKRRFYLRSAVDELWIVDLEARAIERWRARDERPEILTGAVTWHPARAAQPLRIELAPFFAAVHGERP